MPENWHAVSVNACNGGGLRVSRSQLRVLVANRMVIGHLRKGELVNCSLIVSIRAALRLITFDGSHTCHGITRRKQSPGAKRWVERLDRSDGGLQGGGKTLTFCPTTSTHQSVEVAPWTRSRNGKRAFQI